MGETRPAYRGATSLLAQIVLIGGGFPAPSRRFAAPTPQGGRAAAAASTGTPTARPYLASRGMKWIQHYAPPGLSDDDLKAYLRQSHLIVSQGLSKKKQRELGLNQA